MVGAGAATRYRAGLVNWDRSDSIGDYVFDFGSAIDRIIGRNTGIWIP